MRLGNFEAEVGWLQYHSESEQFWFLAAVIAGVVLLILIVVVAILICLVRQCKRQKKLTHNAEETSLMVQEMETLNAYHRAPSTDSPDGNLPQAPEPNALKPIARQRSKAIGRTLQS